MHAGIETGDGLPFDRLGTEDRLHGLGVRGAAFTGIGPGRWSLDSRAFQRGHPELHVLELGVQELDAPEDRRALLVAGVAARERRGPEAAQAAQGLVPGDPAFDRHVHEEEARGVGVEQQARTFAGQQHGLAQRFDPIAMFDEGPVAMRIVLAVGQGQQVRAHAAPDVVEGEPKIALQHPSTEATPAR